MIKKKINTEHSVTASITKEDVKAQKVFEYLTDDQANEVVDFIVAYCNLVYKAYNSGRLNISKDKIQTKKAKNQLRDQQESNHSIYLRTTLLLDFILFRSFSLYLIQTKVESMSNQVKFERKKSA